MTIKQIIQLEDVPEEEAMEILTDPDGPFSMRPANAKFYLSFIKGRNSGDVVNISEIEKEQAVSATTRNLQYNISREHIVNSMGKDDELVIARAEYCKFDKAAIQSYCKLTIVIFGKRMKMAKPDPSKVIPQLLEAAIQTGKERNSLYSEYIRLHYRTTGNLAPGCDAKDFYAALDAKQSENKV